MVYCYSFNCIPAFAADLLTVICKERVAGNADGRINKIKQGVYYKPDNVHGYRQLYILAL
jgi:hypothetical protein